MDFFKSIFNQFGHWLLGVLPTSPFKGFVGNFKAHFQPYLGYLNYFIPIKDFLIIFSAFLGVVVLFYMYSIILRWVKAL